MSILDGSVDYVKYLFRPKKYKFLQIGNCELAFKSQGKQYFSLMKKI